MSLANAHCDRGSDMPDKLPHEGKFAFQAKVAGVQVSIWAGRNPYFNLALSLFWVTRVALVLAENQKQTTFGVIPFETDPGCDLQLASALKLWVCGCAT